MNNSKRWASILLVVFVFMAGPGWADYLGGITFDQEDGAFLPHGKQVNISIDYKVDEPGGARIFARPYTLGTPTPGYGASGGPLVGPGIGTASQFFTIDYGEQTVTHVRVTMVSPDLSVTYLEIFVPVHFKFAPIGIFNIQTSHLEYSRLPHERSLVVDFDYMTNQTQNVRIYARPFTDGQLTPGYSASGSQSLPPSGSSSQNFSFEQDADVTDIRFRVFANDNTTLLDEFFLPFDVHWREVGIYNIRADRVNGESMHNSQNLNLTFTVEHNVTSESRYAWTWCTTDGLYSPGGVYQGSTPIPAGPQEITRFCRIDEGSTLVDGLRLTFGTPSEQLMHFIIPAEFFYGPHAIQNAEFSPRSPAIMSHGEHLEMGFDYVTSHTDDVLIFARPAYAEELIYGMTSSGSAYHSPPSGTGGYWVTYDADPRLANSVFFFMRNLDQTEDLLGHFVDGWWAWGQSSYITPAQDLPQNFSAQLGTAYPNPFNPMARIPVDLSRETRVDLSIFDLRGRLVENLHRGRLEPGPHIFTFNGQRQASGVYFYRLETPSGVQNKAMTLVK